jgi:O-antigen/teichoic acid export membrane protein
VPPEGAILLDNDDTSTPEPTVPDQRVAFDTVSRYLSMSVTMVVGYYAQGKYDRMNAVLSAGLILSILVALTIAAATALLAIFAHVLFDLPSHLILPAKRVLLIFGAGSAIHIISSVYASPIYITQRLYLRSIANAAGVLLPAAIIIPLFIYWRASIVVWVGLTVAARLLAHWTIVIPFGRRGISEIKIRLFAPGARREMKELVQFGGLTVFGSLGSLLYYATDSIMISNLNELGIQQVVNYSVAQRWFPQISMFASSFVLIMGPAMIAKVAVGQFDTLRSMVVRASVGTPLCVHPQRVPAHIRNGPTPVAAARPRRPR